ncbi:MAG TPA: tetratricopeptide repeat protein [Candidatus Baltobacteraceae bacterium]|nr:tetratricopeptide repeat protein [Candidatus Baltobacteraceae bacterium]
MRSLALLLCLLGLATGVQGCAGSVVHWIVNTRVNQGNVALQNGSLHDAETAYRLALRVNPHDARARAGFARVSADIAEVDFRKGNFDDAAATIADAQKYDPQNVRLQALRSQLEDARLKREIVISNYPTYQRAGKQIQTAYGDLNEQTKAIQASYELQLEVAKNTNRLIAYRQLVESGVPGTEQTTQTGPTGSLLPLP